MSRWVNGWMRKEKGGRRVDKEMESRKKIVKRVIGRGVMREKEGDS